MSCDPFCCKISLSLFFSLGAAVSDITQVLQLLFYSRSPSRTLPWGCAESVLKPVVSSVPGAECPPGGACPHKPTGPLSLPTYGYVGGLRAGSGVHPGLTHTWLPASVGPGLRPPGDTHGVMGPQATAQGDVIPLSSLLLSGQLSVDREPGQHVGQLALDSLPTRRTCHCSGTFCGGRGSGWGPGVRTEGPSVANPRSLRVEVPVPLPSVVPLGHLYPPVPRPEGHV